MIEVFIKFEKQFITQLNLFKRIFFQSDTHTHHKPRNIKMDQNQIQHKNIKSIVLSKKQNSTFKTLLLATCGLLIDEHVVYTA